MSLLQCLSSLALRGVAEAAGLEAVGADAVAGLLRRRFTDHSRRLSVALQKANESAWRALEVALAGESWWERCQVALASAQERGFRQQVRAFLDAHPLESLPPGAGGPDFRTRCLKQLQLARKAGRLTGGGLDPGRLARQASDLARFAQPQALLDAEWRAVAGMAGELREFGYPDLAALVELRPAAGAPLLAVAVRYFFQRAVETDQELFRGLAYARLEGLSRTQEAGFAGLAEALEGHAGELEELLGGVRAVVVETRGDVLDIKAELQRQGRGLQELGQAVLSALQQHQLGRRELRPQDSLSIRGDGERQLVKQLVARYRALPEAQRHGLPALLNAVGKLEVAAGDFESAQRDFQEVARMVPDTAARAEAASNAYRAALERRAWPEALAALQTAATLDPERFAPFPLAKFEAERILGAGGFGVAFLCRNRHSGARVVVKTLLGEGLERDLREVFREAQVLEELEHPAIIRVRDCDYADAGRTRPFLVMDYFPGQNLAEYVEQHGPLPHAEWLPLARLVAEGLRTAHARGILHRDVKPANILIRAAHQPEAPGHQPQAPAPGSPRWEVKLIDFGLAVPASALHGTVRSQGDRTLAGTSIAGTLDYAAPEQMGRLKGVPVAPYSDVYGFGKTCCFALFQTPQPTFQHWQQLPTPLANLLGRCLSEPPDARPADFAAVLRELERTAVERAVPVLLDAQPVEDVIPVEPPRPRQRPKPRVERREEVEPPPAPRRSTGRGVFLALLLVGIFFAGAIGMVVFVLSRGNQPRPPLAGLPGGPQPWNPWAAAPKAEPITEKNFPEVLAELKKTQDKARLQALAARLAQTEPTEAQKKKHREALALERDEAAPPQRREAARAADDIGQVAHALDPLLREKDGACLQAAALALQKWGTPENVEALVARLKEGGEYGIFDLRLSMAKALAAIRDPRGAPAVTHRLTDGWDRERGLVPILVSFGPSAEKAVWPYVGDHYPEGKEMRPTHPATRQAAIAVLEQIGTEKSIPLLEKQTPPLDVPAKKAIEAIKKRAKQE